MDKIVIYLSNFTHINDGIPSTESIPLNIGFLASYVEKILKGHVEIKLFNLHKELARAINRRIPHILAGSNYLWNSNLSYHYLAYFKSKFPDMMTVMGGPTFPDSRERRKEYLERRPLIDFYISGEGEIAFQSLVEKCLDKEMNISRVKEGDISGCHYIFNDTLISGPIPERITDLDLIPSPYLNGVLDDFLSKGFTPILQSNRGCPFSCAYCCSSADYYNKVNFFSIDRVKAEIEYIAKRVKSPSIHIHDDNFGMFKQDYEICGKFKEVQDKYDWPGFISAATGKNAKDKVIKCLELLGSSAPFSVSVQTMSDDALENVRRKNIRLNDFLVIHQRLKKSGTKSNCEFILPLPGETIESHLSGIKTVISAGVDSISPYTTMLLPASPLYEDASFNNYEMICKYRVIPRDFGRYEGSNIIEVEKVCVGTKDLSIDDYVFLRGLHLIIYCYYNDETFEELFRYLSIKGLDIHALLYRLLLNYDSAPEIVKTFITSFLSDTRRELWDSEEEIQRYYSVDKNFDKLVFYENGCNLLQKYKGIFFVNGFNTFLRYIVVMSKRLLQEREIEYDEDALNSISTYIKHRSGSILRIIKKDRLCEMLFNVYLWKKEGYDVSILGNKKNVRMRFIQTKKQKKIINDYVKIFGNADDGRGKILTRINPEMLYLKCSIIE